MRPEKLISAWSSSPMEQRLAFLMMIKEVIHEEREYRTAWGIKKPRRKKAYIPSAMRWEIWERDGMKCHYCGAEWDLSLDHKIPERCGGETTRENLVTCCRKCNSQKWKYTYESFFKWKQQQINSR